jgi:hypothetical protein
MSRDKSPPVPCNRGEDTETINYAKEQYQAKCLLQLLHPRLPAPDKVWTYKGIKHCPIMMPELKAPEIGTARSLIEQRR